MYSTVRRLIEQRLFTNKSIGMKKLMTFALLLCAYTLSAQTELPQKIESIVRVRETKEWYQRQATLWQREIDKNSTDENAWINYLTALHYAVELCDVDEQSLAKKQRSEALERLIATMPDSPTRYVMEFYMKGAGHPDCNRISPKVLETVKNNLHREEFYEKYVAYLLMEHPEEEALIADVCRRWYKNGDFPSGTLNHFYNELAGLPQNAVVFSTGDTPTYAYLILQHAKGLFGNIVTVSAPLLYIKEYRDYICRRLGIEPISANVGYDNGTGKYISNEEACLYIIERCNRPAYYASTSKLPSFTDKLYCEGLVFRYSTVPYDNTAVKRRNFEEVYLLDYLREDLSYEYPLYERIKMNYITAFKSLLRYYKECGKQNEYQRLYSLLRGIVSKNKAIDEQLRVYYYEHELKE